MSASGDSIAPPLHFHQSTSAMAPQPLVTTTHAHCTDDAPVVQVDVDEEIDENKDENEDDDDDGILFFLSKN